MCGTKQCRLLATTQSVHSLCQKTIKEYVKHIVFFPVLRASNRMQKASLYLKVWWSFFLIQDFSKTSHWYFLVQKKLYSFALQEGRHTPLSCPVYKCSWHNGTVICSPYLSEHIANSFEWNIIQKQRHLQVWEGENRSP